MNPYTKTRWVLLAALLIWAPIAVSMFANNTEFWFAGAAFIGALTISYIGVEIVGHISDGYTQTGRQVEAAKRQIEALERRKAAEASKNLGRRKDDADPETASE